MRSSRPKAAEGEGILMIRGKERRRALPQAKRARLTAPTAAPRAAQGAMRASHRAAPAAPKPRRPAAAPGDAAGGTDRCYVRFGVHMQRFAHLGGCTDYFTQGLLIALTCLVSVRLFVTRGKFRFRSDVSFRILHLTGP